MRILQLFSLMFLVALSCQPTQECCVAAGKHRQVSNKFPSREDRLKRKGPKAQLDPSTFPTCTRTWESWWKRPCCCRTVKKMMECEALAELRWNEILGFRSESQKQWQLDCQYKLRCKLSCILFSKKWRKIEFLEKIEFVEKLEL